MNPNLTLKQLLKRFPNGFSVAPTGEIYEVIATNKDPRNLPLLRKPGGFIAVEVPDFREGDEIFLGENKSLQS